MEVADAKVFYKNMCTVATKIELKAQNSESVMLTIDKTVDPIEGVWLAVLYLTGWFAKKH